MAASVRPSPVTAISRAAASLGTMRDHLIWTQDVRGGVIKAAIWSWDSMLLRGARHLTECSPRSSQSFQAAGKRTRWPSRRPELILVNGEEVQHAILRS